MKTKLSLIVALLALTLIGCKEHNISKGVVVDKSMTPPYMQIISTGKFSVPITHPATYRLSVRDNNIVETFRVDAQKYSSVCVGDSIRFDDDPKLLKEL